MANMTLKRIGVFSIAKIMGVVWAGLGLVIGIPLGLLMMVFGAAMMSMGNEGAPGAGIGIGLGLFYMIFIPIMYAFMGFIFGLVGGLIYNVASGFIGGVEFELENTSLEYGAPPPPPQWTANQYSSGQQM